jgi:hypothetical protein
VTNLEVSTTGGVSMTAKRTGCFPGKPRTYTVPETVTVCADGDMRCIHYQTKRREKVVDHAFSLSVEMCDKFNVMRK